MAKLSISQLSISHLLIILFAASQTLFAAIPQKPTLTFDSERYTLAYVGSGPAGPFNEYLRGSEGLETWTKMVGVYRYRNQHSARDFALTLQRTVRQNNPGAPCNIAFIPATGEAIVDFVATATKPKQIFELNIFRLRTSGQDVLAYQFAFRVYGPNHISDSELASSRQRWIGLAKAAEIPELADKME